MTQFYRLGIIGCGAIAELGHLPACRQIKEIQINALVDVDRERLNRLGDAYFVPFIASDYRQVVEQVDVVVIATPPHMHQEQAVFFLEHGVHVLCEKPMAHSTRACNVMVEAVNANLSSRLAIGHVRRFFFYTQKMKSLLEQGELGPISSISADEGYPYGWPAYSSFAFDRRVAPGGVMFDLGIHLVDLFAWLGGPFQILRYGDDAIGGLESNAALEVQFSSAAKGYLRISRTCQRSNKLHINCDQGWMEADIYQPDQLVIFNRKTRKRKLLSPGKPQTFVDALASQLRDFVQSIPTNQQATVSGVDGQQAVQVIEGCYKRARRLPLPDKAPIPGTIRWR